jgi:hypothetical protein
MNPSPPEYLEQRSSTAGSVVCIFLAGSVAFVSNHQMPHAVPTVVIPTVNPSTIGQFENIFAHPPISPDLPWLATLKQDYGVVQSTADELITTINGLNIVLKDRNFELMDAIFHQLDVTKLSPEMMLAFVRTTFAARSKLGEWAQLRERTRAELSSRSLDPEVLMKGLG